MPRPIQYLSMPLACLLWFALIGQTIAKEPLDDAIATKLESQEDALTAQNQIDKLADQTEDLLQQYRTTLRKKADLAIYNKQLSNLIKQQKHDLDALQRQLDNVEDTQRGIVPLMLKMIDTLAMFVQLDQPFLQQERARRVASLKTIMDQPDVSLPDKYRRIMESYQIEMDYGRTIEAYKETITLAKQDYTVNILRIGRLVLLFQTLDGNLSGRWNTATMAWEVLPSEYHRSIKQGLEIARKQSPPDFMILPIQVNAP